LRLAPAAAVLLAAGTLLFCGDVLLLAYQGTHLFPMAAPAGGTMMIAGWLAVALGAALRRATDN
jgi:uncharacterized membrane protein YgdD (TMEM256/DUF423 family)